MNSIRPQIFNQNGQMIVEYILLTVITVGISIIVSNSFKENELLGKLISSPWKNLAGMIQNGSWGDPKTTMINHPNHHNNSATLMGDRVQ